MIVEFSYAGLSKVISGGQTGADQAGLFSAARHRIQTGGYAPKGWRTLFGSDPLLAKFGLVETNTVGYSVRTRLNVKHSDATIRLASNFETAGEKLTKSYILAEKKPSLDVWIFQGVDYSGQVERFLEFMIAHSVAILNVAGNGDRDQQFGMHFNEASKFLNLAFERMQEENLIVRS